MLFVPVMGLTQEQTAPTSWSNRVEAVKYLNDLLASRTGFSGFKPQLAYDEEKGELKKVMISQGASPMNQAVKLDGASVEQVSDIVVQVRSEGSLLKIAFDREHVPQAMTAFQFLVSTDQDQVASRPSMAAETGSGDAEKVRWTREFVEAQRMESQRIADPAYIAAETERAEVAWKCADLIQREFKNRPILEGTVYFNSNSGLVHPAENTSRGMIKELLKTGSGRDKNSSLHLTGLIFSFKDRANWAMKVHCEYSKQQLEASERRVKEAQSPGPRIADLAATFQKAGSYLDACDAALGDPTKAPKVPDVIQTIVDSVIQARARCDHFFGPYDLPSWVKPSMVPLSPDEHAELRFWVDRDLDNYLDDSPGIVTEGNGIGGLAAVHEIRPPPPGKTVYEASSPIRLRVSDAGGRVINGTVFPKDGVFVSDTQGTWSFQIPPASPAP